MESLMKKLTTEGFVRKAKIKHNNNYSYSKTIYDSKRNKIIITCPEHGDFTQTPEMHMSGQKCPQCGLKMIGDKLRLSNIDFINKAKAIHGDKYDYDKTNHKSMTYKIIITCKKHGEFTQTSGNHLSGKGCPICKASKGELLLEDIFKKHSIKTIQQFKLPNYNFEYDFYLPDYNLLIEFHGIQHYEVIDFFGGEERFKYTQQCDAFKRSLAREYRIPLIEFNYKQLKLQLLEFEKFILRVIAKYKKE